MPGQMILKAFNTSQANGKHIDINNAENPFCGLY